MMTKLFFKILLTFFLIAFIGCEYEKQQNVLFIIVDDLRPELPSYGKTQVHAPNLTQFASQAVQFDNAYTNIPVCGASRASILTGIKPTSERFKYYYSTIDSDMPEATTIPDHLGKFGYNTVSNGKISHCSNDMSHTWSEVWNPQGMRDPCPSGQWRNYLLPENIEAENTWDNTENAPSTIGYNILAAIEKVDVDDDAYFDGQIATKTIEDLKKFKASGDSFAMFTGFLKPHLPFNAPSKYWDLYNESDIKLAINNTFPKNAPQQAGRWFELVRYKDVVESSIDGGLNGNEYTINKNFQKKLIHGYYACISYTDAQIGRVLNALEELELDKNTLVIITSDHGWSLGEHNRWSKHNLFDVEMRVPLLIKAPGMPANRVSKSFAELVDLYPTICDILDIPKPNGLDGTSLHKNLMSPESNTRFSAVSRYIEGESFISDDYLYSEWKNRKGNIDARMLYDKKKDSLQMNNISEAENSKKIVDSLSLIINNYFKS
jgi:arylsulfatase A-like enzyme